GVSERVGTLAAGKDADFVVLSGEPFALHTRVRSVFVDGEAAYEAKPAGSRKVIRAARVMTGSGEVIAGGSVLIEDKTIRAVGRAGLQARRPPARREGAGRPALRAARQPHRRRRKPARNAPLCEGLCRPVDQVRSRLGRLPGEEEGVRRPAQERQEGREEARG